MPRNSRENQKSYTNIYHVILRSINQQEIFYDNIDRSKFLNCLKVTKEKYQYDLYSYILMNNHVHLLIMDKENNLSKIIQSLATSYAMYFNKKYQRIGHVFYNRFKSKKIESLPYLLNVIRYIHFNCEKAKMCEFDKFYWSSYHEFFRSATLVNSAKLLKMIEMNQNEFKFFHEGYRRLKGFEKDNFEMEETILDDESAIQKIKEMLKIDNLVDIQKFNNKKRDEIISEIAKIEGIKKNQIARILGVSERLIYRAIEKNKN
ncbi:MAG: transposase [Clostridia bacterium]|nr:transposase [Clostridia bacterium]